MSGYILASQSPRRKQLLAWADIEFDIIVSAAAEDFPPDMDVQEVPVHIAQKKAIAVQQKIKEPQHGVKEDKQQLRLSDIVAWSVLGLKWVFQENPRPRDKQESPETPKSPQGLLSLRKDA